MKEVKLHPYVEDGVLKVKVNAVDRENGTCETLNPDGTWRQSVVFVKDPAEPFSISKEWTNRLLNDLMQSRPA